MDRPPFRFAVQATNAAGGREGRDTVRTVEDPDTQRFSWLITTWDRAPHSGPHVPPIMIGGGGRRVLSLTGREADIVSMPNVPFVARDADGLDPPAVARRRIGFVRDAAGDRFGVLDVESSPYFTQITDDPETALAEMVKSTGIGAELLRGHPNILVGSVESVADKLCSRRDELGVNCVTVQQSQIGPFAPVVERLHGC